MAFWFERRACVQRRDRGHSLQSTRGPRPQRTWVAIDVSKEADNPVYTVQLQSDRPSFEAFSKTYRDAANSSEGYAAVMVCSSADQGCPIVYGSAARFALFYIDPKASDGTYAEAATYRVRAMQIGTEAFYVMARAAELRAQ